LKLDEMESVEIVEEDEDEDERDIEWRDEDDEDELLFESVRKVVFERLNRKNKQKIK
jgi:hypothetical protein